MCRHQRRPGQQHPLCCAETLVSADVCHLTCSTSDCLTVGETLCLLFQGGRGDHGVCGEVDQEGHDGPDDRRQTVRQRYHTTAAGECGSVLGSVLRWTVCLRVIRIRIRIWTVPVTSLCSVLSTVLFFCFRQGGTGFAGSGVALRAKEARPVMQV